MDLSESFLKLRALTQYLTEDLLGGPKLWKFAWIINFQKAGTLFFVLALMYFYQNFRIESWLYLALHGGYGLVWLIKDLCFPDKAWQQKITFAGGVMSFFGVLFWYWVMAWLLISRPAAPNYPLDGSLWLFMCTILCLIGCVVMVIADAQKFYTLRIQQGLIKDGIHRYVRHPNYLGEMMIYGSFALLVWHWLAFLIVTSIWLLVFFPNMIAKERSLSRFPEWESYKKSSGWLLPFL
ncbi:methyltransferase family protein [Marinicella rhabdoformis]|uniref:methyltransferase family protein n=1 Tax=Marinicella rhabdoformis TaxID=2580566 RepID=UPI0015CF8BF6|nr:DUF1295 domain-containing protein [Marinicella rhabdoformis]